MSDSLNSRLLEDDRTLNTENTTSEQQESLTEDTAVDSHSQEGIESPISQEEQERRNSPEFQQGLNQILNQAAIDDPEHYVKNHANNNWFEVVSQYQKGLLKHPKNDPEGAEANQGMLVLIKKRKEITDHLLNIVKTPAREHEEVVRQQMYLQEMGHASVSEIPEEERSEYDNFTKNNIKDVKGSAPGSTNPTSDIDVNMSGDGTEFAVKWLNGQFKSIYGNGQESGVVYDVNFYAQDFVPGKMFGLRGKGELDKGDGDSNYYGETEEENENWRTHVVKDQGQIDRDNNEQDISATLMMRVNMSDDDWAMYLRNAPPGKQAVIEEVESRYTERQNLISSKKGELESTNVIKAGTEDETDEELSSMGAENAIYQEKLKTEVEPKRIRFQLLKSQLEALGDEANAQEKATLQAQVDEAYVDLKTAKTKVMTYANAAYYSQGAVVGVVTNKQQLGRMYNDKDATEDDGSLANKNYKNLKLTSDEYYHGFTEQIGFAMHGLHKAHGDAFFTELPMMGKYVHRAYNLLKHLYNFSERAFPFSEEEKRAASDWEGVKQSKALSNDGTGYSVDLENADDALLEILKTYLGKSTLPTKNEELDIDEVLFLIKTRLITTKATIDQFYPMILQQQKISSESETEPETESGN